jgi:hypothetical protein
MALWRLREDVIKSEKSEEEMAQAIVFGQLYSLAQHLNAYKATINSLAMKDNKIEIDITGDLPKDAVEHLNLELIA